MLSDHLSIGESAILKLVINKWYAGYFSLHSWTTQLIRVEHVYFNQILLFDHWRMTLSYVQFMTSCVLGLQVCVPYIW